MGKTVRPALKDPEQILLERAHAYVVRKKYVQISIFTTWYSETELLRRRYGGNKYKHGVGYVWLLSNRDALCEVVSQLRESFPSAYEFENTIMDLYPESKTP